MCGQLSPAMCSRLTLTGRHPSPPIRRCFGLAGGGGGGASPSAHGFNFAHGVARSPAHSEVLRFPPERIASAAVLSCQHIPPPDAALFVLLASLPWIMAHMQPCHMRINARNDIGFHVRVTPRGFFWRCSCFGCYPSLRSRYFPFQQACNSVLSVVLLWKTCANPALSHMLFSLWL